MLLNLWGAVTGQHRKKDESAVGALHDTRPIVVGEHTDWHISESQWSQCLQLLGKLYDGSEGVLCSSLQPVSS